jgi:quinol monooxygenase YgiN
MHCLAVVVRVRAGCEEEAADHVRRLAEATRGEPGNLLYLVHRAAGDPGLIFIYEQYRSAADHAAHRATDHFRRHATEGLLPLAESRAATVYELL